MEGGEYGREEENAAGLLRVDLLQPKERERKVTEKTGCLPE